MLNVQRTLLGFARTQYLSSNFLLKSMASVASKIENISVDSSTNLRKVVTYVEGDLFTCPADTCMAHCVSEDLKMGKGIAVMFKKKFKRVEELQSQKAKPGQCAVLKDEDRFIYYLVTKTRYYDKPTYKTMQSSLIALRRHCVQHDVKKISMPQIGSGLDKLDWKRVKDIIEKTFIDTDIKITVYIYKKK